jgi:hypothetical protein
MEYKRNWEQAMARQADFWEGRMPDRVLARINVPAGRLERWLAVVGSGVSAESAEPPDHQTVFALWEARLASQRDVEDDSLPVMIPSEFDEGLGGGLFGAAVTWTFDRKSGWFSSMARPFLEKRVDPARLEAAVDERALQRLLDRLKLYAGLAGGRFALSPIISIDSLNFAVQARGATNAFLDTYDDPVWQEELLDFSVRLAVRCNAAQRAAIGRFRGGTFDGYAALGAWFTGAEINISADAFGSCRPEMFRDLGLPRLQRLIDAVGSAFLHVHGNAHHLLPDIARLGGLKGIWIVDETPHPFPRLREIKRITGAIPLLTECTVDEFTDGLERGTLPGGVFYIVRGHREGMSTLLSPGAGTADEASRIMEKARAYRAHPRQ